MHAPSTPSLRVQDLRCEYQRNPLGIDVKEPRLSWQLTSDQRNATQLAYQIQVSDSQGELWDSGKVLSDQSLHIPYRGPALHSRQRCTWRVRVWDKHDHPSAWSEPGWWEMGLLHVTDWHAHWIEPDWEEDPATSNPCPYLRTIFALREQMVSARLYVTAHGLYAVSLNGQRVGDAYFTPGYTSYQHRLQYQVYDVGELVQAGENALGVILGDGWYRGKICRTPRHPGCTQSNGAQRRSGKAGKGSMRKEILMPPSITTPMELLATGFTRQLQAVRQAHLGIDIFFSSRNQAEG